MKQPKPLKIEDYLSGQASSEIPLALATVIQAISPTSGKPGDKALVSSDQIIDGWIGGGCSQPAVIKAAKKALIEGEPSIIRIGPKGESKALDSVIDFTSNCLSGGILVIFIEPLNRQPSLCVFGHSPVAISLSTQAKKLGFSVMLLRPELAPERLPKGVSHQDDFSAIHSDFIVIATQGRNDKAAIVTALESTAGYISMVASEKKIIGLKKQLLESNVDQIALDRIHGPAGIEIGAETPAEIALSVLADLVRIRRSKQFKDDQDESDGKAACKDTNKEIEKGGCCG